MDSATQPVRENKHLPLEDLWSVVARLDIIADQPAEALLLKRLAHPSRPMAVSFVNQHAMNLAWSIPGFAATLRSADVLLRDGVGLECCLRFNGCPPGLNMNGTDFIPKLAKAYGGRKVALFGTAEPWTTMAGAALEQMGCNIVTVMDGFRPANDYRSEVLRTKPELVILAMSMPKQEQVAASITASVSDPLVVVNGGAIADFLAQRFPRAPKVIRVMKMEWLFRLALEPSRLADRYLKGGAAFAWRLLLLRLRSRRYSYDCSLPASPKSE